MVDASEQMNVRGACRYDSWMRRYELLLLR